MIEKLNEVKDIDLKFKCIGGFDKHLKLLLNADTMFDNWTSPLKEMQFDEGEICKDLYVFQIFKGIRYSNEVIHNLCNLLRGRMLTENESEKYTNLLTEIYNKIDSKKNENVTNAEFWILGKVRNIEKVTGVSSWCPTKKLFKSETNFLPCVFGLTTGICMAPKFTTFYLYGPLKMFDRIYSLTYTEEGHLTLLGETSYIVKVKDRKWKISTFDHREKAFLVSEIPMGRKEWAFEDKTFLMTLTSCQRTEFACSTNGQCFPQSARCNNIAECDDSSDEENCDILIKKKGYLKSAPPPPAKNESYLRMGVSIGIYEMADISSNDGIIIMDMVIVFMWRDLMLGFKNPLSIHTLNCEDIWKPKIGMSNDRKIGFKIEVDTYTTECRVLKNAHLENNTRIQKLFTDPYMGNYNWSFITYFFFLVCNFVYVIWHEQNKISPNKIRDITTFYHHAGEYIDGDDMELFYIFESIVTLPCRLDLRKYPFGLQRCILKVWITDVIWSGSSGKQIKLNLRELTELGNAIEKFGTQEVNFRGTSRTLGEYYLVNSTVKVGDNMSSSIIIEFTLRSLIGFHLLNSFTPSFLIYVICFATLFFPVNHFNERVMVSLTSLLVLAALFTQASNASVRTSYFKYLDIWYVALTIFCFLVVMVNIILYKLWIKAENRLVLPQANYQSLQRKLSSKTKKYSYRSVHICNFIFKLIFAILFTAFLFIFCIAAMEII